MPDNWIEDLAIEHGTGGWQTLDDMVRFGRAIAKAEREACSNLCESYARKWWSIHSASNKHMETTCKAHDDFCALQTELRRREDA